MNEKCINLHTLVLHNYEHVQRCLTSSMSFEVLKYWQIRRSLFSRAMKSSRQRVRWSRSRNRIRTAQEAQRSGARLERSKSFRFTSYRGTSEFLIKSSRGKKRIGTSMNHAHLQREPLDTCICYIPCQWEYCLVLRLLGGPDCHEFVARIIAFWGSERVMKANEYFSRLGNFIRFWNISFVRFRGMDLVFEFYVEWKLSCILCILNLVFVEDLSFRDIFSINLLRCINSTISS